MTATLINNEGQKIQVCVHVVRELRKDYKQGVWSAIIKDIHNEVHSVLLPENFYKPNIKPQIL